MSDTGAARLLSVDAVHTDAHADDRDDAIRQCGQRLVDIGAVTADYVPTMLEREKSIPTYLGEGVAIPHGTAAGKNAVLRDALAVLRFPAGVDWNGHPVSVCIAIAARGDSHMGILAELAQLLLDPERARGLREASSAADIIRLLRPADQRPTKPEPEKPEPTEREATP